MFLALIALCLFGSAFAQIPSRGSCPSVKGQSDFEIEKFTETWYEVERYFTMFELDGRCTSIAFSVIDNGTVYADKHLISGLTEKEENYHMVIQPDDKEKSKYNVQFPLTPTGDINTCWVLGTDYDTWGVIYCCTEFGRTNLQYAWIVTRERNPRRSVLNEAYRVIDEKNIERKHFWKSEQKRCGEH